MLNFKNQDLYMKAMTHCSYANENNCESNERLEYLGDSILSFIISEHIYHNKERYSEGKLSTMRAGIVCEESLAAAADKLELCKDLKVGCSIKSENGKYNSSIRADTFEAMLAAIYLDRGMESAREWALSALREAIRKPMDRNYKTELQEIMQRSGVGIIHYKLASQRGPDHAPVFYVEAVYKGKVIGRGSGKTRKNADQNAAKNAIDNFN